MHVCRELCSFAFSSQRSDQCSGQATVGQHPANHAGRAAARLGWCRSHVWLLHEQQNLGRGGWYLLLSEHGCGDNHGQMGVQVGLSPAPVLCTCDQPLYSCHAIFQSNSLFLLLSWQADQHLLTRDSQGGSLSSRLNRSLTVSALQCKRACLLYCSQAQRQPVCLRGGLLQEPQFAAQSGAAVC